MATPLPSAFDSGRSSDEGEKHPSADIASITSDTSAPRWSAVSSGVGGRPYFWTSSPSARVIRAWVSCTRRGGRTVHPRSRKCFFSSPRIVGTAYERKSSWRAGSKSRAARVRAAYATWTRSSSSMPRLAYRLATLRATPMLIRTT